MPLGGVGAATIAGKIHVISGRGPDGKPVNTHMVYDPEADTWSEAAPLPLARDHLAIVAARGKIHAIGGRLGATVDKTGQHDVYDPATNSWSTAAPMLTPRSAPAGLFYHGKILVLGGELAQHLRRERGLRARDGKMGDADPDARRTAQFRRCRHRTQCVFRRRLAQARGRRRPTGQLLMFTLP